MKTSVEKGLTVKFEPVGQAVPPVVSRISGRLIAWLPDRRDQVAADPSAAIATVTQTDGDEHAFRNSALSGIPVAEV